jgi:hypothetical protein
MTQYQPTDAATVIGTWGFLAPGCRRWVNGDEWPEDVVGRRRLPPNHEGGAYR